MSKRQTCWTKPTCLQVVDLQVADAGSFSLDEVMKVLQNSLQVVSDQHSIFSLSSLQIYNLVFSDQHPYLYDQICNMAEKISHLFTMFLLNFGKPIAVGHFGQIPTFVKLANS